MKVILSHGMHGLSSTDVYELRKEYTQKLKDKYGDDIQIIDNYNHPGAPDPDKSDPFYDGLNSLLVPIVDYDDNISMRYIKPDFDGETSTRLWHLGRSIQQFGQADAIFFIPNHCDAKGCKVEKLIAELYDLDVLTLEEEKKEKQLDITSLELTVEFYTSVDDQQCMYIARYNDSGCDYTIDNLDQAAAYFKEYVTDNM